MAPRGTGDSSSERMASPSRSRSNVRPRPTVPETITAIHRMPAVTDGAGRASPTTKAKLKISTTTTARNAMVKRISRLRSSIRRSLAAMVSTWAAKPGVARAGSATGALAVKVAHRGGVEAARARVVEDHPPAAQDQHVIGDGARGVESVRPQDHDAAGAAFGPQPPGQPVGARPVHRRRRPV